MGVSEISDGKTTVINDDLYEEDSFTPTNTGYGKDETSNIGENQCHEENLDSKIIPSKKKIPFLQKN